MPMLRLSTMTTKPALALHAAQLFGDFDEMSGAAVKGPHDVEVTIVILISALRDRVPGSRERTQENEIPQFDRPSAGRE